MLEVLEPINNDEKQKEIDNFIYEHYDEFEDFIKLYEELVGSKNEANWDEQYHEGAASGLSKTYRTVKNGKCYSLNVRLLKDRSVIVNGQEEVFDDELECEITIRDE